MRPLTARLLSVVLFLACAAGARAEGLVQITLQGAISSPGGAPVELELAVWNGKQVETLALNLHLGDGTRARDLASLITTRLRRLKARVDFPDENGGGAYASGVATLFIEAATNVNLRLGYGLSADVTVCDGAPTSVRILPPQVVEGGVKVLIATSTFQPHTRMIGRDSIALDFEAGAGAAQISEKLAITALDRGWIADRPTADSWACSRNTDGASVTGCSIELDSPNAADWRLEVKLEVPRADAQDQ